MARVVSARHKLAKHARQNKDRSAPLVPAVMLVTVQSHFHKRVHWPSRVLFFTPLLKHGERVPKCCSAVQRAVCSGLSTQQRNLWMT